MGRRGPATIGVVLSLVALASGCSSGPSSEAGPAPPPTSRTSTGTSIPPEPEVTPTSAAPEASARFDDASARHHVEVLAGRIGPRLTTGPAFREAARYVERHLRHLGYDVRRQGFPVPAGDSWGVPVAAGRSFNVVATPPGFDERTPYVVVGAHLDTVAVAPGAEDNASGVAVLLELARLAAADGTDVPTVLVAFGGEEPRGVGEDLHHFGSLRYVAAMSRPARSNLRAMVSMDRVGVGARVPVCSASSGGTGLRDELLATAREARVPTLACENDSSDHYSFVLDGLPGVRVGGTSYAAYHDETDVPAVVNRRQLSRTGRLIWAWLTQERPAS
jgi:hypothetical protein